MTDPFREIETLTTILSWGIVRDHDKNPPRKFMKGYKLSVYAREGLMFGMQQPLDGPVFE